MKMKNPKINYPDVQISDGLKCGSRNLPEVKLTKN